MRPRVIIGTQKGTIILTIPQMNLWGNLGLGARLPTIDVRSPVIASLWAQFHISYSLNSVKGGYIGGYIGDYYRGYYGGY